MSSYWYPSQYSFLVKEIKSFNRYFNNILIGSSRLSIYISSNWCSKQFHFFLWENLSVYSLYNFSWKFRFKVEVSIIWYQIFSFFFSVIINLLKIVDCLLYPIKIILCMYELYGGILFSTYMQDIYFVNMQCYHYNLQHHLIKCKHNYLACGHSYVA